MYISDDIGEGLAYVVFGPIGLMVVGSIAALIMTGVEESYNNPRQKELTQQIMQLNEAVSNKLKQNMQVNSVNWEEKENGEWNVTFLTSSDKQKFSNNTIKEFSNVSFVVSGESANALKQINVKEKNIYKKLGYDSKFGIVVDFNNLDGLEMLFNKKLYPFIQQTCETLTDIVDNSTSVELTTIGEVDTLTKVLTSYYLSGLEIDYTDFKKNLKILKVSDVNYDKETNESYFNIDFAETINGRTFERKNAVVSASGINWTAEDIYHSFTTYDDGIEFSMVEDTNTDEDIISFN